MLMKPIIINQHSEDKDCDNLKCYKVFFDSVEIWPVNRAEEVTSVNA